MFRWLNVYWSAALVASPLVLLVAQGARPASNDPELRLHSIVITARDTNAHLFSSPSGGALDSARMVIRDRAAFANVWATFAPNARITVEPPNIDFATHDVLVASLGASGNEGPYIVIDTVGLQGGRRVVIVRRVSIVLGCMYAEADNASRPTDVVLVPRDSVHVTEWVERSVRSPKCGWGGAFKPLIRP